ncbi:unnamed protein product [Rhodiola kirilowii]
MFSLSLTHPPLSALSTPYKNPHHHSHPSSSPIPTITQKQFCRSIIHPPIIQSERAEIAKRSGRAETMDKYMNGFQQQQEQQYYSDMSFSGSSNNNNQQKGQSISSSGEEEDDEMGMMMMMDLRRGPWTDEEDRTLMSYIAKHGEGRWNSLARSAGLKRTGKSCRLRWLNYLRPDVRRGNITLEEQLLILELHSRWGNRWSKIAQHLPGRNGQRDQKLLANTSPKARQAAQMRPTILVRGRWETYRTICGNVEDIWLLHQQQQFSNNHN